MVLSHPRRLCITFNRDANPACSFHSLQRPCPRPRHLPDKQMREQKNRVEAMEKRALALAALDQKTLTDTLVVKEYITRLRQALDGPAQSDDG